MIIRRALASDAAALAELGARTFIDSFASANKPEDIDDYVARTYGETQQRTEIEDPNGVTLLVREGDQLIGYAQLRRTRSEHGEVELARLYVERGHHGAGIAQSLMSASIDAARELGASTFWLGVWEHNPRAIRFYEKCGFRDTGSHPFLLGGDLQTDRVMTIVIPPR